MTIITKDSALPEIKDKRGRLINKGDMVKFLHRNKDNEMEWNVRKVLQTGHHIDHSAGLIHTVLRTNLGWRTAYDTQIQLSQ